MKLIIGITGASGAIYAKRIIQTITKEKTKIQETAIIFTDIGKKVWQHEIKDLKISEIPFKIYENDNFFVPFASGSSNFDAMIICPCSMGTMGKIANSIADNLLTRTADVMIKENRKLIIVPREMPYSITHIKNMWKIKTAGVDICPASPAFYANPKNINDLTDTVIQKIFKLININLNYFEWTKKNQQK